MPIIWNDLAGAMGADLTTVITDLAEDDHVWPVNRYLDWIETGIETTKAHIDFKGGVIELIPNVPRGGPAHPLNLGVDRGIDIEAVHLPQRDQVLADVGLTRHPGATTTTTAEAIRDDRLRRMKRNLVATIASHRMGALRGLILDADSSTLADLFAAFGLSQQLHDFDLADAATNVVNQTVAAQRKSSVALDGTSPAKGWIALASPSFMDALRNSSSFEKLGGHARPREMLDGGGIQIDRTLFVEVDAPAGLSSHLGIADGEAMLCPIGVPDLYLARFAPGDYVDAVGDIGVPFYARSHELPLGKGFALEAQSNPIHVVTRPRSVVRLIADGS